MVLEAFSTGAMIYFRRPVNSLELQARCVLGTFKSPPGERAPKASSQSVPDKLRTSKLAKLENGMNTHIHANTHTRYKAECKSQSIEDQILLNVNLYY